MQNCVSLSFGVRYRKFMPRQSVTEVGLKLVSQSTASRAVQRGRGIAEASGLNLEIAKNA